jgi:hypothetical protein
MPTLHDLFDSATDGLPPMPDLAPSARRIAHRRRLVTRTVSSALGSALVIGVGTLALTSQMVGGPANAMGAPASFNNQYLLTTLQQLWPNSNQQLSIDPTSVALDITQDGKKVGYVYFDVMADVSSFPSELECITGYENATPQDCLTGTTSDGDRVLAQKQPGGVLALPTAPAAAEVQSTVPTHIPYAPFDKAGAKDGTRGSLTTVPMFRSYRLHDGYFGQLEVVDGKDGVTAQQMFDLVQSPEYEQLVASAANAGSLDWFGTPPAGIPTDDGSGGSPSGDPSN